MSVVVACLLGFVLGSALQLRERELLPLWVYGLCLAPAIGLALSAAVHRRASGAAHRSTVKTTKPWVMMTLSLLCAAALGWGQVGVRATLFSAQALASHLEGVDIRVTGVVAAMPHRDESSLRFRLDVESAQALDAGAVKQVQLPPHIQLAWYRALPRLAEEVSPAAWAELHAGAADLQAGERWQMVVRLKAPHGNVNPHGFDYELWLWDQGVQATGYVRATPKEFARSDGPVKLDRTWQHPFEAMRQSVRDEIFKTIADPQRAGIVAALAVGDQGAIERADWDVFRATGVAHLMSISGLHITMFAWGTALLVGSLWRRSVPLSHAMPAQHAAAWAGLALASWYALFVGWAIPAQRTIFMLACVTLIKLSGRRWPWPMVWLLVLALVVALDPWALLSAGFWLSFVAVGILFASGADRDEAAPALPSLRDRALSMVREQWVITLALAPLGLVLFNQVSMVGLLANLLAIPLVTAVITPLALLGMLVAPLWTGCAWLVGQLAGLLAIMSDWPFASLSMASAPWWASGGAVLGAALAALKLPPALRLGGGAMLLPLLFFSPERPAHGEFALLAADIGQGNAVLVQTARHSLLYDAGPKFSRESDAGARTLVPLLRALGDKLDVLMVSHRDADHIGGAQSVLAMQTQARLISSIEPDHELNQVRSSERCEAGQYWEWDGVRFEVLHPTAQDYDTTAKPNAMSCVLRVSNARAAALLPGDLEASQEVRLVDSGVALAADVLLVPHHGSKTSSSTMFLDAVKPKTAWVQAGYRNRFQHPVMEVMARYESRGIEVIQSPSCGAARWHSEQPTRVQCERQEQKRYWHHPLP